MISILRKIISALTIVSAVNTIYFSHYLPATFPPGFKESLIHAGIKTVEVIDPARICKGVYSTGVLGNWIKEQALMIATDRGMIVITDCAHPGIVYILEVAKKIIEDKILLVMGGFHLSGMHKSQLEKIKVNGLIIFYLSALVRYAARMGLVDVDLWRE